MEVVRAVEGQMVLHEAICERRHKRVRNAILLLLFIYDRAVVHGHTIVVGLGLVRETDYLGS